MCLIISNPECRKIPVDHIANAYRTNHDGFGVMWAMNGKLRLIKGMNHDRYPLPRLIQLFEQLEETGAPYVAHFRYATHGTKNVSNAHPFWIHQHDLGGIAMVHNGTLSGGRWRQAARSDTSLLAEELSSSIRFGNLGTNDLFGSREATMVAKYYERDLGGDKLVFMNGEGQISYVNERNGSWIDGVWYSNTYSIGRFSFFELEEWID